MAKRESGLDRSASFDFGTGDEVLTVYATSWLKGRHDLAVRTRETYGFLLANFILPELGHRSIRELSSREVRTWHSRHAAIHPSTAAKAYRLLASIMLTAILDELIVSSPCRVKGAGTEHASERPIATIDEVSALTAAMPAHLQIAVDLAVWCQLRRGEIFGLERRDVDLDGGTIRIERSRTFLTSGTSITKVPKTRAGRRVLSVPTSPLGRLRQHMDVHVDDFPESPILVGRDHRALSATALQRAWQRARVVVGRDDLHFHDLRHTGLTLAASTGATTAEIMRRAGHTSSDAALRYQHATLERDRILASRLEDLAST